MPNVGKSSLIARVSAARPKIADYPFTTLVPNLGVVRLEEGISFVIADLPGLVAGAHRGVGRGDRFLRHAERTRLLIHMLDPTVPDRDALAEFASVNEELRLYQEDLAQRKQLVCFNKIDLRPPATRLEGVETTLRARGYEVFRISALTGEGVPQLMGRAAQVVCEAESHKPEEIPSVDEPKPRSKRPLRVAKLNPGEYAVSGEDVERAVVMTDLENEEAVRYLHRRLERMGVIRRLRDLGAKNGDSVMIGKVALDFVE
jgi:GTP-binding protein